MRHNKKFNHLGRKANHRKAMLANMACDLIKNKRIQTTLAKAKSLRMFIEPLLTKAKTDNMNNRRLAFSILKQKQAITELFKNVGDKIANRPGGYCRILKTGFRLGDSAQMAMIELVDYNENMLTETNTTPTTRKSTRRGKSKKKQEQQIPASTEEKIQQQENSQQIEPKIDSTRDTENNQNTPEKK